MAIQCFLRVSDEEQRLTCPLRGSVVDTVHGVQPPAWAAEDYLEESWLSRLGAASTCPSPVGFEGGTANSCEGRKVPMADLDSTLVETPQVLAQVSLDLGSFLRRCRRTATLRFLGDKWFAL
ncbi:hypothetical protein MTO96_040547 [Rhipicephalus appendiculatus]